VPRERPLVNAGFFALPADASNDGEVLPVDELPSLNELKFDLLLSPLLRCINGGAAVESAALPFPP
jgi:hypothetical protein